MMGNAIFAVEKRAHIVADMKCVGVAMQTQIKIGTKRIESEI